MSLLLQVLIKTDSSDVNASGRYEITLISHLEFIEFTWIDSRFMSKVSGRWCFNFMS